MDGLRKWAQVKYLRGEHGADAFGRHDPSLPVVLG